VQGWAVQYFRHAIEILIPKLDRFDKARLTKMGSERLPLQNKGIFRNLPSFDDGIKDLTAIVTGANGISGFHTMRVLLESPQRWKKVWAASRRQPPEAMMKLLPQEQRDRVEHVALDFLSEPEEIAKALKDKGVTADVIFFYSYAQPAPKPGAGAWSNAQELVDVNCKSMLPTSHCSLSTPMLTRL
jgi:NADP-dependent 3-hydroxy acid dehydrogenase YdfG